MVNIPYHAAKLRGSINRYAYNLLLPLMTLGPEKAKSAVPADVYSLSCERDLPELIACIHSFLRFVGTPKSFTVISDGSHSLRSKHHITKIDPCLKIVSVTDMIRPDLPLPLKTFAEWGFMGKKLAVLWSLPVNHATIYTDADVLFFRGANELAEICRSHDTTSWYLPDIPGSLDERLLVSAAEAENPINAGFMIIKAPLNWHVGLDRLCNFHDFYINNTEQTTVHITLHQSGARPLDRNTFVLKRDDQFIYPDLFSSQDIAMRHYVGPVRHKFWYAKVWK